MFILPQEYQSFYLKELERYLHDLLFTLQIKGRASNFPKLIEAISYNSENLARRAIVAYLEKMDKDFFDSRIRKDRYYVKDHLPRTLVCMFGEITFTRTVYIDKDTGERFIYVDSKMGIRPRIRYTQDVRAYAYECYADENSMIKVGKELGNLIHAKFSLKRNDDYAFSRQTVYNFLKVKPVHFVPDAKRKVSRLFVLMDEKFIGCQDSDSKIMAKAAMVYEEAAGKGKKKVLKGKTFFTSADKDFGCDLLTYLDEIYELEEVKEVYLMADGGGWIKEAFDNLELPGVKQIRCLDRFHSYRALYELCKDITLFQISLYYIARNDKESFIKSIKGFVRSDKDKDNYKYLVNHFGECVNMYYALGPCAMEQCICHHLMSQFTSVPKAYSSRNIERYLHMRDNYRNGLNLKKIYLEAIEEEKAEREITVLNKAQLDFSIFDKGSDIPYYNTASLKGKMRFIPW